MVEYIHFFKPLLQALKDLGGSGTPAKVYEKIIANEKLSEDFINEKRNSSGESKFENNVRWARQYLTNAGYIDGSERGRWSLTTKGKDVDMTEELAYTIYRNVNKNRDNKRNRDTEEDTLSDVNNSQIHYWIYSPGRKAEYWDSFYAQGIMAIGWDELGDLALYNSKSDIKRKMQEINKSNSSFKNDSLALWEFANEVKVGDVIFVKNGLRLIVGRGIVDSEYIYDENRDYYRNLRHVKWIDKGEWNHPGQAVQKALTDITQYTDYVNSLNSLFDNESEYEESNEFDKEIDYPDYTEKDFFDKVYMNETDYKTVVRLIKRKKNVVIQGAPGVGKTFIAKRLAYSIMGKKAYERVKMIQFHQSYSYEDFVQGFRPIEKGFDLRNGVFYNFCKKAKDDDENEYFFIIDEINRGNLSKIFGELFMLIENDKRNIEVKLLYSDEQFSVPDNVYIIGTMNTADRSLALLDYALRRRFSFFEMKPAFESAGFKKYLSSLNSNQFDSLIECVKELNKTISEDDTLGEGFCIGHSYFCNLDDEDQADDLCDKLTDIIEFEIIPLLKEYWFDEPEKVKIWSENLRNSIK